jgi:hypothetical protein
MAVAQSDPILPRLYLTRVSDCRGSYLTDSKQASKQTKITLSCSIYGYSTAIRLSYFVGVVWCGVVWCGLVWFGLVWFGWFVRPLCSLIKSSSAIIYKADTLFYAYNASKEATTLRIRATNINKIYMNHPQRHLVDYPDNDCDSLATAHAFLRDAAAKSILTNTKTQTSPRLRFFGTPASLTASFPSVSSDGTKLGLERSTSKMTSGSVATWASA